MKNSLILILLSLVAAPLAHAQQRTNIRPFRINVKKSVLDDLDQRLARTRWPDQIEKTGWQYGIDLAYMKQLVEHWRTKYDWRAEEKKLNQHAQFTTTMDGLEVHFVHVRSSHADATPLLLVHGWPGSFCEFHKMIPMLTEPDKHGGRAEDAFHVVVPSLPGFGFSESPREPGWSQQRISELFAKLMARLKYEHYGAQGGDWGAGIVRWLAANDGAHCIGAHSNFPPSRAPRSDVMRGVSEDEIKRFQQRRQELADHTGYASIQGTRPLTLAYGLNDSPAGMASWIIDKFWAWSDHKGDLDNSYTKDELLTNVMIYWVTESMPSSVRIYFESRHGLPRPSSMTPFDTSGPHAPLGFALFPREINVPPRMWVERSVGDRFVHWTEFPSGGHFAAMEEPKLLAEDVRTFFATVRERAVK